MPGITDYFSPTQVSGYVTNVGNIFSQWMANEHNSKLAAQANQWSIDQWNRENQYNLPVNQVQRLQDAGINPGILYGQGGLMNEAAQSPGVTTARVSPYIMDPLTMAQVANLNAQTDKTRSEIPVNEAMVNEINSRILETLEKAKALGFANQLTEQTLPSQIQAAIAKNNFDKAEREAAMKYVNDTAEYQFKSIKEQYENLKKDGKIKDKVFEQKVEELKSLKARASIDQYAEKHKEAGFWLGKIDSLWDLIALGMSEYKDVLDKLRDKIPDDFGAYESPGKTYSGEEIR